MFMSKNILSYHNNQCRNRLTSRCKLCLVDFNSAKLCRGHINNVHRKYPEETIALKEIERGVQSSGLFKMKCNFCPDNFLNIHVLKFHVASVHKEQQQNTDWKCEFCNFVITPRKLRSTFINKHMKTAHNIGTGIGINSQIVQPKENEALKNFNTMMQMLTRKK